MTLPFCILGVLYLIGISLLIRARRNAPEGYEDETGFHYTQESAKGTCSMARKAEAYQLRQVSIRPLESLSSLTRVESRPEGLSVRRM